MIEIYGYLSVVSDEARAAALEADLVVASPGILETLGIPDDRRLSMGRVLPAIADLHERVGDGLDDPVERGGPHVVVLAAGDPGFFGCVRRFRADGLHPTVHAAPSSVAAAFAAVGLPWDDAQIVTAHGQSLAPALAACRALPKVAVLTAPGEGVRELAQGLADLPRWYVVAERLGAPDEKVAVYDGEQVADLTDDPPMPNVVLVLDAPPDGRGALGRPTAYVGGPRPASFETAAHPEKAGPPVLPVHPPRGRFADAVALLLGRNLPVLGEHVWVAGNVAPDVASGLVRTGAAVVDLGHFVSFGATGSLCGEIPGYLPPPQLVVLDDPRLLPVVCGRGPERVVVVCGDEGADLAAQAVDALQEDMPGVVADVTVEHASLTDPDRGTRTGYLTTLTMRRPQG